MNLSVKIGKLKLKNPVMVASGTFGYAKEFEDLVALKKLGAIVTKTITLKPRQGNPMPRTCETPSGMLNSIGLQNEGMDNFIKEKLPYLSKIGTPIIVSISGDSVKEFCELAKRLNREKAVSGIELNISCPNVKVHSPSFASAQDRQSPPSSASGAGIVHRLIAQDKDATYEVVRNARKATNKTLLTKLSPNVTDIVEIAKSAEKAGTDAVSLINTVFGMARVGTLSKRGRGHFPSLEKWKAWKVSPIAVEESVPTFLRGGLSGPCIKPIALRMVWEVAQSIKKPVIGIGGIMTAEDAIEFLIAGAKAVQVGTANFVEPGVCEKIIRGIEKFK